MSRSGTEHIQDHLAGSARSDVAPPAGLPDAKTIKTVAYDSVGAAKNRTEELEKFDKIFSAK